MGGNGFLKLAFSDSNKYNIIHSFNMAGPIRRAISFIARKGKERRKGKKDRRSRGFLVEGFDNGINWRDGESLQRRKLGRKKNTHITAENEDIFENGKHEFSALAYTDRRSPPIEKKKKQKKK